MTTQLKNYFWQGTTLHGNKVSGESNAYSRSLLKNELRQQGIIPYKIRKKILVAALRKIQRTDLTVFTRQMATMLKAGIPIVQALDLLVYEQNNSTLQTLIKKIKMAIEGGDSIAITLKQYPKYFNHLYCNLIAAGEQAGTVDTMIARIATYREKIDKLISKTKKALIYPCAIILTAIIVMVILLVFVVPSFQATFTSLGGALPAPTLFIIHVSQWLQTYGWLLLLLSGASGFGFMLFLQRSIRLAETVDHILLKLPLVGTLVKNAAVARFSRTLATVFAAGLSLTDALTAVATTTGNRVYGKALLRVHEHISSGYTLKFAIKQTQLFPPMVIQMIGVGEEIGALEEMLNKTAELFEQKVDTAVDNLASLLEPCIMIILGLLIGGLIVALYLPIFKLGSLI